MHYSLNYAYHHLGKIIFESGIAEAFGIDPDQQIDFNNEGILNLIEFIVQHADESIASYKDQRSFEQNSLQRH